MEVYSFDNLERELKKISHAWGYRRLVRRLLAEIERIRAMPPRAKDVTAFLPILAKLEKKLEIDVQGYPPPE